LSGDLAKVVTGAIKKACINIREMPAHHTTYPGSDEAVFQVEVAPVRRSSQSIELNQNYLARFGVFRVPAALWLSMGQYACWLEPAIINEWVKLMQGWDEKRSGRQRDISFYLKGLEWRQEKRDTTLVRERFSSLASQGAELRCTWSDKRLQESNFVIDHCFPWSRWFNNDLWNLMPATSVANGRKGDKLPSAALLAESRNRIIQWWSQAFPGPDLERRFHCEAQAALPMLNDSSCDLEDVFSAMMLQQKKLKANQQLAEWSGMGR
jgi:hypothetical protein